MVDAEQVSLRGVNDEADLARQVAGGDLIVLNKADLVDAPQADGGSGTCSHRSSPVPRLSRPTIAGCPSKSCWGFTAVVTEGRARYRPAASTANTTTHSSPGATRSSVPLHLQFAPAIASSPAPGACPGQRFRVRGRQTTSPPPAPARRPASRSVGDRSLGRSAAADPAGFYRQKRDLFVSGDRKGAGCLRRREQRPR